MKPKQDKKRLRDINKALKIFPDVVKFHEKVHREKEKVLKNFEPLSRQLKKIMDKKNKMQKI